MPPCRRGGRAGFEVVGRPRRVRRGEGTPPYGAGTQMAAVVGGGIPADPHVATGCCFPFTCISSRFTVVSSRFACKIFSFAVH